MKYFLFIIFLFSSHLVSAVTKCSITTYPTIYRLDKDIPFAKSNLIKKTNCSTEVQQKFFKTIENIEGSIDSKRLQVIISQNLTITPSKIKILSLENFLKDKLQIHKNTFIKNINFSKQRKYLSLNREESLAISCINCDFLGHKSIKLTTGIMGSETRKYIWAELDLLMQSYSLSPKYTLNVTNQPLSADSFKKSIIYTQFPERFFLKINSLKYYKINRPLTQGKPLEFSALSPVHLVRPGVAVTIELQQNGIHLLGKAVPTRAGRLGDVVQLINQKTKRQLLGKVIDYNKVLIEL